MSSYGVRLKGRLDMSSAKSMILMEVITLDSAGNLSFKYGDCFSSVGERIVDSYGQLATYLLGHNKGTLLAGVKSSLAATEMMDYLNGIPYAYNPFAGIFAGNLGNNFVIHFFHPNVIPSKIYVYGQISGQYKAQGYGGNIYTSAGELTFSTTRPIMGETFFHNLPDHQTRETKSLPLNNCAAVSSVSSYHYVQYGYQAIYDKFGFSPMVTSDNFYIMTNSMFQGNSPAPSQTESPTYGFIQPQGMIMQIQGVE